MVASNEHRALVELGAKWLGKQGFGVVATEIQALRSREQPDVIGFRANCSAVIEVKVSRGDFRADARKPERTGERPGLGVYRFYLSPPGVVEPGDLPAGWGLLHATQGKVLELLRPQGNLWPAYGQEEWREWQHLACSHAERAVLYSIARRLTKSTGRKT